MLQKRIKVKNVLLTKRVVRMEWNTGVLKEVIHHTNFFHLSSFIILL